MPQFYEFFAGCGMAREGLGSEWACLYANDFDPMKVDAYRDNWGEDDIHLADINDVTPDDVPGLADLAWASFPCQDLSLAGNYAGIGKACDLAQTRSGTFWAFWRLIKSLDEVGRAPPVIVLENVYGVLTAKGGRDFAAIGDCFAAAGYRFGALLINAEHFVPQSRPRVFVVGVRDNIELPAGLTRPAPDPAWHPRALTAAHDGMTKKAQRAWVWWNLPSPVGGRKALETLIEARPKGVRWHTPVETQRLVGMMSARNLGKLERMKASRKRTVGTVYKRTRQGEQRAELRTDGIAGCLRTPAGGSSRQLIVVAEGDKVRSRLLSAREAANLMGLPRDFKLPSNYNDAYHVAGDGVAVPVVRHLATSILRPIVAAAEDQYAMAAE